MFCWLGGAWPPATHVKIGPDGQLDRTTMIAEPLGLGGRDLQYGQSITVGRFRCTSETNGLSCVVVKTGEGLLIGPSGITPIGSSTGRPAPTAAVRDQAVAVNRLLAQSTADRDALRSAIADLESCRSIVQATATLQSVVSSRQVLITEAGSLSLDLLPNGTELRSLLYRAMTESASSDRAYASWGTDLEANGCNPSSAVDDPNFQAAQPTDKAAEVLKAHFVVLWDPLATRFALPPQTENSF